MENITNSTYMQQVSKCLTEWLKFVASRAKNDHKANINLVVLSAFKYWSE